MASAPAVNEAIRVNAERIPCDVCRASLSQLKARVGDPLGVWVGDLSIALIEITAHTAAGHPQG